MKHNLFRFLSAVVIVIAVMSPLALLAQTGDDIVVPGFFATILSASVLAAVPQVVGMVQWVKKLLRLKGWYSVALAVVVAFVYSFYAFYTSHGLPFVLAVGATVAASAILSYKVAAAIGDTYVEKERG